MVSVVVPAQAGPILLFGAAQGSMIKTDGGTPMPGPRTPRPARGPTLTAPTG